MANLSLCTHRQTDIHISSIGLEVVEFTGGGGLIGFAFPKITQEEKKATPAQLGLNWIIHFHGQTIVTITGATRLHQAEESAAAMQFRLSVDELAQLDELSCRIR